MEMATEAPPQTLSSEIHQRSIELHHRFNQLLCKLAQKSNLITEEQSTIIFKVLKADLSKGAQTRIEDIFLQYQLIDQARIEQVLYHDLFQYHRTIIELAVRGKYINAEISKTLNNKMMEFFVKKESFNLDAYLIENNLISEKNLLFLQQVKDHIDLKGMDQEFGKIAVSNELVSREEVDKAFAEQTRIFSKTRQSHYIGDILVDKGEMRKEDRDSVLLIQNRVREENWEEILQDIGKTELSMREESARFGAIAVKNKMLTPETVKAALNQQAIEAQSTEKPRWIGQILVEDFGLSETDRKKVIKEQIRLRIDKLNLELALHKGTAKEEIVAELDKMLSLTFAPRKLEAFIRLKETLPQSITQQNINLWLLSKNVRHGILKEQIKKLLQEGTSGAKFKIAEGQPPEAGKERIIFHFEQKKPENSGNGIAGPVIVKAGEKLASRVFGSGKNGTNVCGRLVKYTEGQHSTWQGKGVTSPNGVDIFADMDGQVIVTDKGIFMISPEVVFENDLGPEMPAIEHDINLHVKGMMQPPAPVRCRNLNSAKVSGKIQVTENMVSDTLIADSEIKAGKNVMGTKCNNSVIIASGKITVSQFTGKSILICHSGSLQGQIFDSKIVTERECNIKDAMVSSSIISARESIQLDNVKFDAQKISTLRIGDSHKVYQLKSRIESIENHIEMTRKALQEIEGQSDLSGHNVLKNKIEGIEDQIKQLKAKRPMTFAVKKEIENLAKKKRKIEREYREITDVVGDELIQMNKKNEMLAGKMKEHRNEINKLRQEILNLYKAESISPIIRISGLIPQETLIQGRYSELTLDRDYQNVAFQERLNRQVNAWEIQII